MEKLKLEDFQKDLENKNYDKVHKELVNKIMELIKQIAEEKEMKLPKLDLSDEELFYKLRRIFESSSVYFDKIDTIMHTLDRWEDDYLNESKESKVKTIIRLYNSCIYWLGEYKRVKEEINKKGFENLKEEKINEIITLFKEMLKYKNKKYDDNWNFEEWLNCISEKYNYFYDDINDIMDVYYFHHMNEYLDSDEVVQLDKPEEILAYDQFYYTLESDYKEHAYDYIDVDLKEGQTYKDIVDEEKEKLAKLFKEMLDYINAKYEKETFENLRLRVIEEYPWYEDKLHYLYLSFGSIHGSYIQLISHMEWLYNNLKDDYKNIEENKKEYEERQKEDEEVNIDIDEDLLFDDNFNEE